MERLHLFILLFVLAFLTGCQDANREPLVGPNGEPVVYASIAPLAGLTAMIAGEHIEVRTLVGKNQDPHDFSPTPKQLVELSNAAAFFTSGMPFEKRLVEKLRDSARNLRIIDATEGINLLENEDAHHDDHEHDHDHDHGSADPHIWLSPPLLKQQVRVIVEALKAIDPEHADAFEQRAAETTAEIESLHAELTEKLAPFRGRKFYVYHGAFAYFAKAYGLEQEAIEIGGRRPEQKRIVALIESAKTDGVKMIFVQPQFDPASGRTIAEAIGGEVVPIDPLGPDLFGNLRKIAVAIASMKQAE